MPAERPAYTEPKLERLNYGDRLLSRHTQVANQDRGHVGMHCRPDFIFIICDCVRTYRSIVYIALGSGSLCMDRRANLFLVAGARNARSGARMRDDTTTAGSAAAIIASYCDPGGECSQEGVPRAPSLKTVRNRQPSDYEQSAVFGGPWCRLSLGP